MGSYGSYLANQINDAKSRIEAFAAENARLREEAEKEDRAGEQVISERDEAEEAMSRAYQMVTGAEPQWSNMFGYAEALEEIEQRVESLRTQLAERTRERDLYREGYEAFMVRPGHDRQRTCYAGDGWDRVRSAVEAVEHYKDTLAPTPPEKGKEPPKPTPSGEVSPFSRYGAPVVDSDWQKDRL